MSFINKSVTYSQISVLKQNILSPLLKNNFAKEEFELLTKYYPTTIEDITYEMIIQTWSEHCSHKVFRGKTTYNNETLDFSNLRSYKNWLLNNKNKNWKVKYYKGLDF